jgi:hypothetical protein
MIGCVIVKNPASDGLMNYNLIRQLVGVGGFVVDA